MSGWKATTRRSENCYAIRKKRCVTVLEYIAGVPAFRAEGLTAADFARVQLLDD
jgi:hypothetical protein